MIARSLKALTEIDWLVGSLSEEDAYRRPWLVLEDDW